MGPMCDLMLKPSGTILSRFNGEIPKWDPQKAEIIVCLPSIIHSERLHVQSLGIIFNICWTDTKFLKIPSSVVVLNKKEKHRSGRWTPRPQGFYPPRFPPVEGLMKLVERSLLRCVRSMDSQATYHWDYSLYSWVHWPSKMQPLLYWVAIEAGRHQHTIHGPPNQQLDKYIFRWLKR